MSMNLKKTLIVGLAAVIVMVCMTACGGAKVEMTGYYISKTDGMPYEGPYGEVTLINSSNLTVYSDNTYECTVDTGMGFGTLFLGSTNIVSYGTYTSEKDDEAGTVTYTLSAPTRVIFVCTTPTQEAYKDSSDESTLGDDTLEEFMAQYNTTHTVVVNAETHVIVESDLVVLPN